MTVLADQAKPTLAERLGLDQADQPALEALLQATRHPILVD
jgi:hypothetical protein